MILTIGIAALAACGIFMLFWALLDSLFFPVPRRNTIFVVRLEGDSGRVEQTICSCLRLRERRGYGERLVFIDGGIDAEARLAAALLLRAHPEAVLCGQSQIADYIRWEKELGGAGAD